MVVRKNTETCRAARYRAQDAHHRAQKFVFKNVSTPIDPAHRRPHHPRGVKNRPLDATPPASPQALGGEPQWTRPSTGRLVDLLIPRDGKGGKPNEQAPQRPGAGLPDPDGVSTMNAARRPAQHIAWHRDLCPQGSTPTRTPGIGLTVGPRGPAGAHEHPRLSPAPGSAAPRPAGTARTAASGHQRQKASGHIVVMHNSDATPVVPSKMSQRGDDTGRASHRGPPPAHLTRDPTT